jgi:hypothetical protein
MAYWSPTALGPLAQSESSGNASLIHFPNNTAWGGSSTAGSSASGLYGFTTPTWQTYAPQAGVDISQYPYAYTAPASVQSQVASVTPISNWTCPGCNSTANTLALSPGNVSSSPMDPGNVANLKPGAALAPGYFSVDQPGAQPPSTSAGTNPTTGLPNDTSNLYGSDAPNGIDPATGQPYASMTLGGQSQYPTTTPGVTGYPNMQLPSGTTGTGGTAGTAGTTNAQGVASQSGGGTAQQINLSPSTAADLQSYITAPITAFENWAAAQFGALSNWFTRGMLILLAIVIILVALWKATGGSTNPSVVLAQAGKAAA